MPQRLEAAYVGASCPLRTSHPPPYVLPPVMCQVRISCAGIVDILRPTRHAPLQQLQAEDLQALGALLLCIACRSPTAASGPVVTKSMAFVGAALESPTLAPSPTPTPPPTLAPTPTLDLAPTQPQPSPLARIRARWGQPSPLTCPTCSTYSSPRRRHVR